jgi:hypothetical protein
LIVARRPDRPQRAPALGLNSLAEPSVSSREMTRLFDEDHTGVHDVHGGAYGLGLSK